MGRAFWLRVAQAELVGLATIIVFLLPGLFGPWDADTVWYWLRMMQVLAVIWLLLDAVIRRVALVWQPGFVWQCVLFAGVLVSFIAAAAAVDSYLRFGYALLAGAGLQESWSQLNADHFWAALACLQVWLFAFAGSLLASLLWRVVALLLPGKDSSSTA